LRTAKRPDVLRRRIAWFDGQLDLDPVHGPETTTTRDLDQFILPSPALGRPPVRPWRRRAFPRRR
ncbi:hypothetical protein VB636_09855, partial [Paracoccus sp. APAP_BH8]|uniref:hypothetical protein n=1 Tax=Paracoccus sp. APAP_BH8 TaxID=3110237 RepID=UPI002FD7A972